MPRTHTTLAAPLLTFLAVCAMAPAQADEPPKPASGSEAIAIIADARRIVTPNGVERLEKVRIGGIDQWVSVRGTDRRNPVLLHIHGGPGYISIPMSWWFSRGWEEYFTIVQWDQRAAGKTHLLTDPAAVAPTLTRERMIADAEEMAAWVRREFGKDKIFVLGHRLLTLDLTAIRKLAVPLILFEGRHDRNVNSEVAAAWFDTVEAPEKHLVWFEHSAHIPMTEEPGKFLLSLVRFARPIAEKAGSGEHLNTAW